LDFWSAARIAALDMWMRPAGGHSKPVAAEPQPKGVAEKRSSRRNGGVV
jgi:hypothetical protein